MSLHPDYDHILYVRRNHEASDRALKYIGDRCAVCDVDKIETCDRPDWLDGVPLIVEHEPDFSIKRGTQCLERLSELYPQQQPNRRKTEEIEGDREKIGKEEEDVIEVNVNDLVEIEPPKTTRRVRFFI